MHQPYDRSPLGIGVHLDFQEIRENLVAMVSAAIGAIALFSAGALLPGPQYVGARFMVFFVLLLFCIVSYFLHSRKPLLARGVLTAGLLCGLALALRNLPWAGVPYFAAVVVLVAASLTPRLGLLAAVGSTGLLLALIQGSPDLLPSLVLLWSVLALSWMAGRGLYVVADWAWSSQQHSMRLMAELRARQQELNQTVTALTEATRRLERTGNELAVARLRADDARRLKERFAANISHELRTPLNLILGFSEMIYFRPEVYGETQLPMGLRRDVHHIYQSSRQLLDLVNDVLDLSRIDGARMTINREPTELALVIDEAVSTIRNLVRGRPVELVTEVPDDLPTIDLDRTRIRQVLLNLLNNAVRFTDEGSIAIAVTQQAQNVNVCVADTGAGIPQDELPRIFDEFHQVDMSLRRSREGAGLGLAISRRFVQLHGGRIWVESALGEGSRFYFTLPLEPNTEAAGLRQIAPSRPSTRRHRPTVVLLESDHVVVDTLTRHLPGYAVHACEDPSQVAGLVDHWHPRAVLLNAPPGPLDQPALPPPSGLPPSVPVIYCALPSQAWIAQQQGVLGALTKPVSREDLLRAMAPAGPCNDVLVIDDDRGFVQLVRRYLEGESEGCNVRWAYDGREGIEEMRRQRPQAVLLDLIMPVMDGFEFLRQVRQEPTLADVPVIIVTATDLGEQVLAQFGSELRVRSSEGLAPDQVLRYLAAILDVTHASYPSRNAASIRSAPHR